MREVARAAWLDASSALNPGAQYASGRRARSIVDQAREDIAELLDCEPIEVIFTGSGTEADNLAVLGLYHASPLQRAVSSPIEHPAVLEPMKQLGAEFLPVDSHGRVSSFELLDQPAAVAALMWANNETGAIQPIEDFVAAATASGTPAHIDAVQAVGHVPVSFAASGATTLAASAHKFGGPRGVGLLLAKRSVSTPIMWGGGQQRGLRPGTLDVAGAAATAAALREAVGEQEAEARRIARLRDELLEVLDDLGCVIHTTEPALPGHLHVSVPGAEGDSLIMLLDSRGIEASTGSACASGVNRASHVLLAMGISEPIARGALRFTLGPSNDSLEDLPAQLAEIIPLAQAAGMA